ncbi:TPA: hypothetical protein ACTYCL_006211, partial [Klebsiella michiganensis]
PFFNQTQPGCINAGGMIGNANCMAPFGALQRSIPHEGAVTMPGELSYCATGWAFELVGICHAASLSSDEAP